MKKLYQAGRKQNGDDAKATTLQQLDTTEPPPPVVATPAASAAMAAAKAATAVVPPLSPTARKLQDLRHEYTRCNTNCNVIYCAQQTPRPKQLLFA